jgi:hypothetical protein
MYNKIIHKKIMVMSLLFCAAHLAAMDPELQVLVEGSAATMESFADDVELYRLIGKQNRHYLAGHEESSLLKAFDRAKLEQQEVYTALIQPATRRPKKHHPHKAAQHKHSNDQCGHAKDQDDGGDDKEEKEGAELAQAHFIAALLSVLSQQEKERADKLDEGKKKVETDLTDYHTKTEKKDKCDKAMKFFLALATIAVGAWGSSCQADK